MPHPPDTVRRLSVASSSRELSSLRASVGEAVIEAGGDADVAEDFELAVSELATNVMRHTAACDLEVLVIGAPDRWVLEVSEADGLQDLDDLEVPADSSIDGRGLLIVRSIMDSVQIVERDGHRSVRCVRSRRSTT